MRAGDYGQIHLRPDFRPESGDVGKALIEIRDRKLYRAELGTFEEYCKQQHEMSKTHANRLIECVAVEGELTPIGVKLLSTESQYCELDPLTGTDRQECSQSVVERAEKGEKAARSPQSASCRQFPS